MCLGCHAMIRLLGLTRIERRRAMSFSRRGVVGADCPREVPKTSPYARQKVGPLANARTRSFSICSSDDINMINQIPPHFLREADAANYDAITLQRKDMPFDNDSGKPLPLNEQHSSKYVIRSSTFSNNYYNVEWEDGRKSRYPISWVKDTLARWKGKEDETTPRILWSNLTEAKVRSNSSLSLPFPDIVEKRGMAKALKALYQYGFVLITDTPIDDGGAGIAALASSLSGGSNKKIASSSLLLNYKSGGTDIVLPNGTEGPLRTLYGTIWSTTSSAQSDGASVADSAYGKGSLPLHTDMTYHRDPPGLQIFTMVQSALEGGESVFADGFAAAAYLKQNHPDAFTTLSSIVRTYRCVDEATGWHLEASGPVIATAQNGVVTLIRHNDLDRLPDLPPRGCTAAEDIDVFYKKLANAHRQWDSVLSRDEFRLIMSLKPGDTAVVANQRCFHARYSFRTDDSSPRTVMGCYVSQDELNSRFRREGFRVFP